MTASQQAKSAGLKSLAQLSEMIGRKPDGQPIVSVQTLNNWHKNKQILFKFVIAGAVQELKNE